MSKASALVTSNFNATTRAIRRIRLMVAAAVLVAAGALSTLLMGGPKLAGAAGEERHPGIFRVPLDVPLTERAAYSPGIALGNFDGAFRMATMYKSGVLGGNTVAFGEAKQEP